MNLFNKEKVVGMSDLLNNIKWFSKHLNVNGKKMEEKTIDYPVIQDDRFIARTSDTIINKRGCNGLLLDMQNKTVKFINTSPDGESNIYTFLVGKNANSIDGIASFSCLIDAFEAICSKFENYSYHDLCDDLKEFICSLSKNCTNSFCYEFKAKNFKFVGPTKEVFINNKNDRMYFYEETGTVIAKSGNESQIIKNVSFSNVDDFTTFAEEVARLCAENDLDFMKDYAINYFTVKNHLELRKAFIDKGEEMKANIVDMSFYDGYDFKNYVLVYYDNKKTILFAPEDDIPCCIPVKLDEDFQTAEKFQLWIENDVKPKCKVVIYDEGESRTRTNDYKHVVYEFNKQYYEKHENELLTTQLDEAQNNRQLNKLAEQVYNRSSSEVKMNGKPNHDKEPKTDDTGTVGKMLNKLENDKQLDKLANNKGNNGRE